MFYVIFDVKLCSSNTIQLIVIKSKLQELSYSIENKLEIFYEWSQND